MNALELRIAILRMIDALGPFARTIRPAALAGVLLRGANLLSEKPMTEDALREHILAITADTLDAGRKVGCV